MAKKLFCGMLAALVIVCALPMSAVAADGLEIVVSEVTGLVGEEVKVAVGVANNSGFAGLNLRIGYDEDRLEAISYEIVPEFKAIMDMSAATVSTGLATFAKMENTEYNGTVLVLHFRILDNAEAGDATVSIMVEDARDENEELLQVQNASGKVTVAQKTRPVVVLKDVIDLMKCLIKVESIENVKYPDPNGDGKTNVEDVIRLIRYLAGQDVKLY